MNLNDLKSRVCGRHVLLIDELRDESCPWPKTCWPTTMDHGRVTYPVFVDVECRSAPLSKECHARASGRRNCSVFSEVPGAGCVHSHQDQ